MLRDFISQHHINMPPPFLRVWSLLLVSFLITSFAHVRVRGEERKGKKAGWFLLALCLSCLPCWVILIAAALSIAGSVDALAWERGLGGGLGHAASGRCSDLLERVSSGPSRGCCLKCCVSGVCGCAVAGVDLLGHLYGMEVVHLLGGGIVHSLGAGVVRGEGRG